MKILHVEGGRNLYGGAHQILLLIEGLSARGVENHLACRIDSALSTAAQPFAIVHEMQMGGDLDVGLIGRLCRLIRRIRPDIVHLHSRIGADVMGGIASRLTGTPVIHSRRQDNPEHPISVALKYRLHDRVIAISSGIARVLLDEGLPAGKLRVVRDAVDISPFAFAPDRQWLAGEFSLPSESLVIGVVAQLIRRKGHQLLLDAMPSLLADQPNIQVLFFGKGPMEKELLNIIHQQGLNQHVRLVGFRNDLPRILPSLDLVVHPAFREGLGVSLLQASSAAVPIVAARTGGIPEAVKDGVNGLLFEPGDIEGLVSRITQLLGDPIQRKQMGAAGRELIDREFNSDVMVEGNLRVYYELMSKSSFSADQQSL